MNKKIASFVLAALAVSPSAVLAADVAGTAPMKVIVNKQECNDDDWTAWETWTTGTISFIDGFYGGMGYTRGIDVERRFSKEENNPTWQMKILNYHRATPRGEGIDELIIQYDPRTKKIFIPTQDFGMRTAVEDKEGVKGIPGYITGYTTFYPDRVSDLEKFDEIEGEMTIHTLVYWDGLLLDDGSRGKWVVTESMDKFKLDGFTDYNVHIVVDECANDKNVKVKFDFTNHPHGVCYEVVSGLVSDDKIDEIAKEKKNSLESPASLEFSLDRGLNTVVAISYDRQDKRYVNKKEIYCMPDEKGGWKALGEGTFTEDAISGLGSNMGVPSCKVDVEESVENPGIYRMVNPYKGFASQFSGLSHHEGHNHYVYFDASIPTQVMLAQTATGVRDEKLGDIYLTSKGYEEMMAGKMRIEYAKYLGKLEQNVISFPQEAIGCKIPEYVDGHIWWTNTSACFGLRLPETNGVDAAGIDCEPVAEYFTLQGIRVGTPVKGELYIVRRGERTAKEIY